MQLWILISFLSLLSIAPAARAQQQETPQIPASIRQRLAALVPDPPPAKARAQAAPAFYSSSTLYEYIDGAADVFQNYDVQAVFHQDFKTGPVELTVDIFDMGQPENAFGMYASERSPKYDFLAIGTEGYHNEGILNFFCGAYYVKLAGFGEGADAVLHQFGRAISGNIGGTPGFPAFLSKLPESRRKARTEQYLLKDPLGHPFLGPAYQAVYDLGQGDSILMVSVAGSTAGAASRWKSLEEHFRHTGRWQPAPEFGNGAMRGSNSFEGSLLAAVRGQYLVILLNPPAGSESFFQDAEARLP